MKSRAMQKQLTTAIKTIITNPVTHKDTNVTFLTSSYGPDVDPETVIAFEGVLCGLSRTVPGLRLRIRFPVGTPIKEMINKICIGAA